ncbi:hypothetical protein [Paracidovorax avenae]|uniref:hypothetical protein n=1 Tax=Paracidovorax avenae TaxID=80867 RepID=UPI00128FC9DC|nr:hypothetical protein [Paracidovorax avenae]
MAKIKLHFPGSWYQGHQYSGQCVIDAACPAAGAGNEKTARRRFFRFLADSAPVANGGRQGHPGCFA